MVGSHWRAVGPGQVPLTPGNTYYVEFTSLGCATAALDHDYLYGSAYRDGGEVNGLDLAMTLLEYAPDGLPDLPDDCGSGCAGSELCRWDGVCVARSRGSGGVEFIPSDPTTLGDLLTIAPFHPNGLTNVGLLLESESGSIAVSGRQHWSEGGNYHWPWDTAGPLAAGVYRATFTADPGVNTVYSIGYVEVRYVAPEDGSGGGDADPGGGDADPGGGDDAVPGGDNHSGGGDAGSNVGEDIDPEYRRPTPPVGCGCTSGGSGLPPWLFLLALLLIRGRRFELGGRRPPRTGRSKGPWS